MYERRYQYEKHTGYREALHRSRSGDALPTTSEGAGMTIKELSQLYHLNREIEHDKVRLRELEDFACGITSKITGMPHVAGIADKTAIAAEIADCRASIKARVKLCAVERNRLERYIASVRDSLMRRILTLRFVDGLSWRRVAAAIGKGYTDEGVKKACYRFILKS